MKASKSGNQLELATFVLAFLVLFFSLTTVVYLLPPTTPGSAAALPYPQNQSLDARVRWYIESGQWRADVATFVTAVKYLVEPAPVQPATS